MYIDKLYDVMKVEESEASICLSDETHPIFKAHFPNAPILPGFCHFEIISRLFNMEITAIKKVKFVNVATPKQVLTYKKHENKFTVICEEKIIANFAF